MSTPTSMVRQRGPQSAKKAAPTAAPAEDKVNALLKSPKAVPPRSSEWDYKLALAVITALAFATRFWGINHPDQVVFDEVHFGKVSDSIRLAHV
jgi:dolichyl-phosphate-mannose-protein mannosyltransferase